MLVVKTHYYILKTKQSQGLYRFKLKKKTVLHFLTVNCISTISVKKIFILL